MTKDKIYIPLLVVLAVLLLWQWQCGKPKPEVVTKEVVKTKLIPVQGDTVFIPRPYRVTVPGPERVKEIYRTQTVTVGSVERGPVCDTAAVLDYYSVREYSDTVQTKYGPIVAKNTVTENKLQLSEVTHNLTIPEKEVEKTVYLRSTRFFLGANVFGNEHNFLQGFGINAAVETKKGIQYEAGLQQFNDLGRVYSAGVKVKIFGK